MEFNLKDMPAKLAAKKKQRDQLAKDTKKAGDKVTVKEQKDQVTEEVTALVTSFSKMEAEVKMLKETLVVSQAALARQQKVLAANWGPLGANMAAVQKASYDMQDTCQDVTIAGYAREFKKKTRVLDGDIDTCAKARKRERSSMLDGLEAPAMINMADLQFDVSANLMNEGLILNRVSTESAKKIVTTSSKVEMVSQGIVSGTTVSTKASMKTTAQRFKAGAMDEEARLDALTTNLAKDEARAYALSGKVEAEQLAAPAARIARGDGAIATAFVQEVAAAGACEDTKTKKGNAWKSSTGHTCAKYASLKWCENNKHPGAGWKSYMVSLAKWGVDGLHAGHACCACGGGSSGKGPANKVEEKVAGVGGYGGSCKCPDGQTYQVGDNNDHCGSMACYGGEKGACESKHVNSRAGRKVTCGKKEAPKTNPPGTAVPATSADGKKMVVADPAGKGKSAVIKSSSLLTASGEAESDKFKTITGNLARSDKWIEGLLEWVQGAGAKQVSEEDMDTLIASLSMNQNIVEAKDFLMTRMSQFETAATVATKYMMWAFADFRRGLSFVDTTTKEGSVTATAELIKSQKAQIAAMKTEKERVVALMIKQFGLVAAQAQYVKQLKSTMHQVLTASREAISGAKQDAEDAKTTVEKVKGGKADFDDKMKECTNKADLSKDYDDLLKYATDNKDKLTCYKAFQVRFYFPLSPSLTLSPL